MILHVRGIINYLEVDLDAVGMVWAEKRRKNLGRNY